MKEKIYYYSNPLTDDFAGTKIDPLPVDEKYNYSSDNVFFRIGSFILYRLIAKPVVSLYVKIWDRQTFVNKKSLVKVGRSGAFIYANHTLIPEDAFIPNMLSHTKRSSIITGPDAVSIKGLKTLVRMFGVIPIPSSKSTYKNYFACIKERIEKGNLITVYPEAHIWPYYTGIRPFKSVSFHYPVEQNKPVFVLTNTYHTSKIFKRPRIVTYIDGPFFPDKNLQKKEAIQNLRDLVYEKMLERSKSSNQEYVKYIYSPKND